ncbi:MAG: hypothetical protein NC201_04020 [Prevotella sp.]|nr:hypothetical protein [Bacteroides sp.]MCM1366395.1 hypothetical protein [Prevotella sp.]MCM1436676.1 hypothetical protein [Prevotella sp.]
MKTVLVVAYHFPPEESSCSEKNLRIAKILLDNGYKVKILTKPGENWKFKHPNLKILRTSKTGFLHRKNSSCSSQIFISSNKTLKSWIIKIASRLIIPDGTIDWFFEVRKYFKCNRSIFNDVDIILSISSPYSAHIISYYISKLTSIPFILSYGDPWIYEPKRKRGFFRYRIEYALEKRLIDKSSGVLLITEWNKSKYSELYEISNEKISTYNIGYDQSDCLDIKASHHDKFHIVYGGSLDPVHRNPEPFLAALKNISGIDVSIYNSDNNAIISLISKYGIEDKVHLYPIIKSSDFFRLLYSNDALILFGNKTPFQVPGKVFTYIATGKTIIYIKNNDFDDDGTEMVLKRYSNCIIIKNNEVSIRDGLMNYFKTYSDKQQNRDNKQLDFEFHKTMYPIVEMVKKVLHED